MTPPAKDDLEAFSIAEATRIAGIGRNTIYDALADGRLRARKIGRRTLILRADLRDFLAGLPAYRSEASGARAA